ncbi:MAG: class C sortase [Eubacteriales bacterium]|nr:class C sortase [Eubacteriales bacterium]
MKKKKGKKKDKLSSVLLIVILIAGLSLLLYPSFSDYWNSIHSSRAIASYSDTVAAMDTSQNDALLAAARAYNSRIKLRPSVYTMSDEEKQEYRDTLDITGTGIMGYVDIPAIKCTLPIYHSTDESVLQIAAGHLEWTSLPVGGKGTHTVLSGHRGLPSAKLFSDLDKIVEGDQFLIRVLQEVFTYEVDQILIVEPEDISSLTIDADRDQCTLVTCTPYGINTHRLLVRGHRVANSEEARTLTVSSEATLVDTRVVAGAIAIPVLFILLMMSTFSESKARRKRRILKEVRR